MDEIIYSVAFTFLHKNANAYSKSKLIAGITSPSLLFTLSKNNMTEQLKLNPKVAETVYSQRDFCLKKAEEQLQEAQKRDVKIIDIFCEEYPAILKEITDMPVVLYIKGNSTILSHSRILSVVGTRCATHYGVQQTKNIISELALYNVYIASGLAVGIDTEAHHSALANEIPTIAVLGHGLDIIYPSTNKELAKKILDSGGTLISEMPFGTNITTYLFPRRNRIIAGIAQATLVIEASTKGGALITAARANDYNRTVFAIPGRNDAPFSQGCNSLIKNNLAILADSCNDITEAMCWDFANDCCAISKNLPEKEIKILELIEKEKPCSIDLIFAKTNYTVPEILSLITKLEISGFIKVTEGCMYEVA
jgi:DNA processing protein